MSVIGAERRVLASCASTNDEAAAWARAGAPEGAVVVADAQTAGRGRMGRAWSSPPGEGLYLSVILRPPLPPAAVPRLTLAVGLALSDAMKSLGCATRLKWPNDLLADDADGTRKLAGVLTEMATQGMRVGHVIVGIGLNVGTERFPAELASIATSLRRVLGRSVERSLVLETLLDSLERRYRAFVADPLETVAAFRAQADFLGRRVSVRSGDEWTDGIAEQIDDEGALHVRRADGTVHRCWAGDVQAETD